MPKSPRSMAAQSMLGGGMPQEDPLAGLMGGGGAPPPAGPEADPMAALLGGAPPDAASAPEQAPDLESSLAGIEESLAGSVDEAVMEEIRSHIEAIRELASGGEQMSYSEPAPEGEASESIEAAVPEEEGDKKGIA